jgi:DNA-binding SARP family transcriptional activator
MTVRWTTALAGADQAGPVVHLLGRPQVTDGDTTYPVAVGGARLLAFLSLHCECLDRGYVAGSLWPDVLQSRAAGNLRCALNRLNSGGLPLVKVEQSGMALRDGVLVDVRLLADWATRVVSGRHSEADLAVTAWNLGQLDLLPGWCDDWVLVERERLRQRLLHALELVSRDRTRHGRYAEAVDAALVAVNGDPLRESGQRALIEAYLAEGNWPGARRQFDRYERMLHVELGVRPSSALAALVAVAAPPRPRPPSP